MYVFMNMVVTRVKNWSPDMIPSPFDGKIDETKDELPRFVDLICFIFFNFGSLRVDIKHKNGYKWCPRGSPWAKIWHVPYYHIVKFCLHPKDSNFNEIKQFLRFLGGHKVAKILYIAIYIAL